MNRFRIATLAALMLVVASTVSHAVTLAQYSFDGGSAAATTVDPLVNAADVTGGAGLSNFDTNFGGGYATAPTLRLNPGNPVSQNVGTAFDNGNFAEFMITANQALNIQSFSFEAGRGGSSGLPRNVGLRSSLTGVTNLLDAAVPTTRPNFTNFLVDLTAFSEFGNVSGPVTFQLIIATDATGRSIEFDDVTISGVAVPEPATAGLALLGFAGFVMRRRSRA